MSVVVQTGWRGNNIYYELSATGHDHYVYDITASVRSHGGLKVYRKGVTIQEVERTLSDLARRYGTIYND